MALTNSLCVMLRTSPFHRENYARLILGVIIQFYQRCFDRFQLLVARDAAYDDDRATAVVLAAQWAQSSQFAPCLAELLTISVCSTSSDISFTDSALYRMRIQHESSNFVGRKRSLNLELLDLISFRVINLFLPHENFLSYAIYTGVWYVLKPCFCTLGPGLTYQPIRHGLVLNSGSLRLPRRSLLHLHLQVYLNQCLQKRRYRVLCRNCYRLVRMSNSSYPYQGIWLCECYQTFRIYPFLMSPLARRFQALLKTYDLLAELILYTIRMDVRCRTIFHLDLASKSASSLYLHRLRTS
jgi:hypothetical protein